VADTRTEALPVVARHSVSDDSNDWRSETGCSCYRPSHIHSEEESLAFLAAPMVHLSHSISNARRLVAAV